MFMGPCGTFKSSPSVSLVTINRGIYHCFCIYSDKYKDSYNDISKFLVKLLMQKLFYRGKPIVASVEVRFSASPLELGREHLPQIS